MDPMIRTPRYFFSLSAIALITTAPAMAQVTAAELWAEWQTQSAAHGQTVTAAQVNDTGNGLQILGFSTTYSDADVTTIGRLDSLTMTENGDGTVTVEISSPYDMTLQFSGDDPNDPPTLQLLMDHENLSVVAGGTPDARSYTYSADTISITEGEISGGGEPPAINALIVMRDLASDYVIDGSDLNSLSFEGTWSLASLSGGIDVAPPDRSEGSLKATFGMTDISAFGSGDLGNLSSMAANPETIPEGFDMSTTLTYGAVDYDMEFREGSDWFEGAYSNDGGGMHIDLSIEEFGYGFDTTNAALYAAGSDIPVPVEIGVGSAELRFAVPMAASDVPVPFSARLAYQDLTANDQLWAMADPMQAVPRDPISVVADVSGTVRMFIDLMTVDPESIDAPPGEIRSLTINELRLAMAGAELTGSGDMTFAEGQIIPMPVGQVDLQLSGGFALLDRLQATGLVPVEQLAMARGLAGAFARPGATPDTLETTIEFTEGGGITANGVPLQ